MNYKKIIWPVVGVLVIASATVSYMYSKSPMEIRGDSPVKMTIDDRIVETGNIAYENTQTLYAERSGKLVTLPKGVGERVQKGELVVKLDDQGILLQLKDAEAKVASAKAQLEGVKLSNYANQLDQISLQIVEGKRQLELSKNRQNEVEALFNSGAVSEAELKGAKDQSALLESQLNLQILSKEQLEKGSPTYQKKLSQSQLEQAIAYRDQMHYEASLMKVAAPLNGIILEKFVENGEFVSPGSPLIKIGDASGIKVEVDILSDEIEGLNVGDAVVMSANYMPNVIIDGKVTQIAPMAKETVSSLGINQKRLPVTIEVSNHLEDLIANMPMEVSIIKTVKNEVLCQPITAIREDEKGVYVIGIEQGKTLRIDVKLGIQSGQWQEILEGVTMDMVIASEPGSEWEIGQKVKVVKNEMKK